MLGYSNNSWAIESKALRKDYPGLIAVKELSFKVSNGVVHGFLGPNGAGKSTTIRMMSGLLRPSSGNVLMCGVDPVISPNEVKSLVGLLPENPPLYRDMTVREFLFFTARLHQVKNPTQAFERVVDMVKVQHVAHRLIGNLSKGYRQRVGIAQALIHDPKLIILDEPTAGLDPESVVEVRGLIKKLKATKTVLFSSHLLHEVEEVCDSITIISQGELLAHGTLAEVRERFSGKAILDVNLVALPNAAADALKDLPYISAIETTSDQHHFRLHLNTQEDIRPELVRAMVKLNLDVRGLQMTGSQLEQVFLAVTKQKDHP
jgi:ABC-2 type transport system ATP-binding protein